METLASQDKMVRAVIVGVATAAAAAVVVVVLGILPFDNIIFDCLIEMIMLYTTIYHA
jgi:hypothetical protein